MTIQERTKKVKQAQELIAEVLDDMDQNIETDEVYNRLQEGYLKVHKAYLRLKREVWKQPLGVK